MFNKCVKQKISLASPIQVRELCKQIKFIYPGFCHTMLSLLLYHENQKLSSLKHTLIKASNRWILSSYYKMPISLKLLQIFLLEKDKSMVCCSSIIIL